jgi:hypothetical protein
LFQRDDMEVLDEPLYANFLQVTGVDRPYREEILSKIVRLYTLIDSAITYRFALNGNNHHFI